MWINNNLHLPLKAGCYKCLVDTDGFGNLEEVKDQFFNGKDWCNYKSCKQYIVYWKVTRKDQEKIFDKLDKEMNKYYEKQNLKK